jgi:hypothetical protein
VGVGDWPEGGDWGVRRWLLGWGASKIFAEAAGGSRPSALGLRSATPSRGFKKGARRRTRLSLKRGLWAFSKAIRLAASLWQRLRSPPERIGDPVLAWGEASSRTPGADRLAATRLPPQPTTNDQRPTTSPPLTNPSFCGLGRRGPCLRRELPGLARRRCRRLARPSAGRWRRPCRSSPSRGTWRRRRFCCF